MGAFEHVISLLSFVYALALAHLLTTVARLIGSRERVRFSWLHAYWMLNAAIVLVVSWIGWWDVHKVPSWNVASLLIVLAQAFVDYMQAALVCPEIPPEGGIDLVAFHATHSRRYVGAFAADSAMALIANLYFASSYDVGQFLSGNLVAIPALAIAVTAAVSQKRWVQAAAPVLLFGLWIYYFVALQDALR